MGEFEAASIDIHPLTSNVRSLKFGNESPKIRYVIGFLAYKPDAGGTNSGGTWKNDPMLSPCGCGYDPYTSAQSL
jgi:hypothetical protein